MGRRESIESPSVAARAATRISKQQFAVVQLQVRSLMLEAKALREEAMALRDAPHRFGDYPHRCGLLHGQALLCSTEAMELMRLSCLRPDDSWESELDSGLAYGC